MAKEYNKDTGGHVKELAGVKICKACGQRVTNNLWHVYWTYHIAYCIDHLLQHAVDKAFVRKGN